MNEFEKNQDKNIQTEQQGDKPALFETEQGQQGLNQEGQLSDQEQPEFSQKGETIDEGQQEHGQAKDEQQR